MQCTAKSKQSGEQCKRSAAIGRSVCAMHGGKSPSGLASSTLTHGRYSKHLPTRLMARYQEAENDPELLSMRAEIHLLDARLADLLVRVDTGESGHLWEQLVEAKQRYHTAPARDKGQALYLLLDLIDEGAADHAAWQDVRSVLDQRRRTVESERKRLVEMQQNITVERAMLLVGAIAGIIRAHVSDAKQLAAISTDLGALLHSGAPIEATAEQ